MLFRSNALAMACEQRNTQFFFQSPYLVTDGPVGNMDFFRRAGKVLVSCCSFESTQRGKVGQASQVSHLCEFI